MRNCFSHALDCASCFNEVSNIGYLSLIFPDKSRNVLTTLLLSSEC